MAWIIATCCLSTPQESAFDMHTNDFVSILTHSIPISKIRRSTSYESIHQKLYGSSLSQSTDHVIEMGWIPPLYYTALKCRVPHIRFQAIRLLERSPHREGVWAATTAVAIARRVMQMEDSESYGKLCKDAAFPWEALPAEEECVRPPLDEHCIVHDVQIVLPDEPMGKVAIRCKRMKSSEGWEFLESVYDVRSASWSEETEAAYADCQSDNVK
ncbi:hypothetical protein B0A55_05081 [Friedmanniomyces simplex]|uniref:Uncharacterized protein n=1 Tax=Friedmanniomyces simplex TaxID=329884 RepID=A0A4U0XKI9_9PEZI|nr:hypothetical protein B0A55_05081 [Friedmanniomyces simplex]